MIRSALLGWLALAVAHLGIFKSSGHVPKQGVLCLEGREKEQVDKFATTNNTHHKTRKSLFTANGT